MALKSQKVEHYDYGQINSIYYNQHFVPCLKNKELKYNNLKDEHFLFQATVFTLTIFNPKLL